MARPRRDAEGPSAQERIIGAFWDMLAEGPYSGIKVAALARRAHVSVNTLYYHFDNIGQVAESALAENSDPALSAAIVAGDFRAAEGLRSRDGGRFLRVLLFARSGSVELTGMLARTLRAHWMDAAGVGEGDLTDADRRDLAFVFGGVVAMLGDASLGDAPQAGDFLSRPLGAGVAQTMRQLAQGR